MGVDQGSDLTLIARRTRTGPFQAATPAALRHVPNALARKGRRAQAETSGPPQIPGRANVPNPSGGNSPWLQT